MKKRLFAIILALAMAVCVFPVSAFADATIGAPCDELMYTASQPLISDITTQGLSGSLYHVYCDTEYVGAAYSALPKTVKLCQAFCCVTNNSAIAVDGFWGPNTSAALYNAQSILHQCGYGTVFPDYICGNITWNAFYWYTGGGNTTTSGGRVYGANVASTVNYFL